MKKTLLTITILSNYFILAQTNSFDNYNTNQELMQIKKSVENHEKKEFYKRYLLNQLVENMQQTFLYKNYSNAVLRKFADTIMNNDSSQRYDEKSESELIRNLDGLVGQINTQNEVTSSLTSLFGDFPVIVNKNDATEHTAFEEIPGEIFKIIYYGGGIMTTEKYYKINDNNLEQLDIFPDDKIFNDKIRKYIRKKEEISFFSTNGKSYSSIEKKLSENSYLIGANLFVESDPSVPLYELEYKTKDFKTFTPYRIKLNDENSKWKLIK